MLLLGWVLLGIAASGAVVRATWARHRRAWREERSRTRRWLIGHGIDPGPPAPDPAAWRLLLTADLSGAGSFTRDVAPARERAGRRPSRRSVPRSSRTGG